MIRAIIFDCFGVLTSEGWLVFKRQHFEPGSAQTREASALRAQVDAGLIGYGEFVAQVAALAGVSVTDLLDAIESNVPNDELFIYIKEQLKPHYKIGLLSNAARDRLAELFGTEHLQLFDDISLSFSSGAIKPQPQAFQGAAERLGVATEECIFVDDQERHVTAAAAEGMHAVLYEDIAACQSAIERITSEQQGPG